MSINRKKRNKLLIILLSISFLACVISYAVHAYISNYYHSNKTANDALISDNHVQVNHINEELIAFEPNNVKAGFIFYPGGKVEFTAYAPLLHELAQNGILCIVPHMPGNLAVLDYDIADDLKDYYPDISNWYIGGHSLGGSMAATYAAKHSADFSGIILLASYSTSDLSATDLLTISIYGSNDGVMNRKSYEKYKTNLPSDYHEFIIDGGNHAYFGCYGQQKGDGSSDITNTEQIHTTVDYIMSCI